MLLIAMIPRVGLYNIMSMVMWRGLLAVVDVYMIRKGEAEDQNL